MKAPGTAYDNDLIGKDPQPDNMSAYVHLPETDAGDNGGVHINSGIPNKAFYLTAIGIGGNAWEAPGHIWYESLKASNPKTQFQDFADTTCAKAGELYRVGSAEQRAVLSAWRGVGIRISGMPVTVAASPRGRSAAVASGSQEIIAVSKQIDDLSSQIKALAKDVASLKAGSRRRL
jgi:hypothetical protein